MQGKRRRKVRICQGSSCCHERFLIAPSCCCSSSSNLHWAWEHLEQLFVTALPDRPSPCGRSANMMALSRPQTPMGLSPRGSFVNVRSAAEPGSPLFNEPSSHSHGSTPGTPRDEKGAGPGGLFRQLQDEAQTALLAAEKGIKAEQSKKDDVAPSSSSPGSYTTTRSCGMYADL